MKKYILLVFLFLPAMVYCQSDSLFGYNDFLFGKTKPEIIKILKDSQISFDTVNAGSKLELDKNYITYTDMLEFSSIEKHDMLVTLYFDSTGGNRLYRAQLEINRPCGTLEQSKEYFNSIFAKLTEKYGPKFTLVDNMKLNEFDAAKGRPKTLDYTWQKANGKVWTVLYLDSFFKNEAGSYTNETDEVITNGQFHVSVNYYHTEFHKNWLENHINDNEIKLQEKENEVKKKL